MPTSKTGLLHKKLFGHRHLKRLLYTCINYYNTQKDRRINRSSTCYDWTVVPGLCSVMMMCFVIDFTRPNRFLLDSITQWWGTLRSWTLTLAFFSFQTDIYKTNQTHAYTYSHTFFLAIRIDCFTITGYPDSYKMLPISPSYCVHYRFPHPAKGRSMRRIK